MSRFERIMHLIALCAAGVIALTVSAQAATGQKERYRPPVADLEDYVRDPLPPGFSVQHTDADGPVYVDANGLTLYQWPTTSLRNGQAGDRRNEPPVCDDVKQTVNTGLMSPYPPGLLLPDLDTRPTCTQMWPPAYAPADAKPVGKWGLVARSDGRKQWTFDGLPVYRCALDIKPGQVNGYPRWGRLGGDAGAYRHPIGPTPNIPPEFQVTTVATGRLLSASSGFSVYTWDGDQPNKSNCKDDCLKEWRPVLAGQSAQVNGDWGIVERSPGVKQWTFRKRPLYTHVSDSRFRSFEGGDVNGWHNVYTQRNPPFPSEFTVQATRTGSVLADKNGKTLYVYRCVDDAVDNLLCDHPLTTQAYRFAICGRGDPDTCNEFFPYALAPVGAKTESLIWGTMYIDPKTGHPASADKAGALHVWTYRDRPIYTHSLDQRPGDINADSWGEFRGLRNGFKGLFLRDDFFAAAG